MRRIVILLAGFAVISIAAESRLSGQSSSATANLSVSATVSKNCTISTAAVAFGAYDSVSTHATAPLDGTGTVIVTCTKGAPAKVGLNAGGNAQGTTRRMTGTATEYLTYELYKDAAHASVWGNTAADALDVPAAVNQNPQNFTVYGRVPQNQTAAVGAYTDTVVATVNF
jgi:spore coat protein U domain-containing protein, fimbrial subunit CupE1/2/3/6